MNQYETALEATGTAINSAGSGYRENAEYLKSFEAQINMVKNAWTETVLAMQESGLGDAMVIGLRVGLEFFRAITSVINTIGVLPALLGSVSVAMILMNKKTQLLSQSLSMGLLKFFQDAPANIRAFTASLTTSGAAIDATSAKAKGATASIFTLKGALSTFLPVAIIMAAGAALTALTSKIMEAAEKQKELRKEIEDTFDKGVAAVTTNREEVMKLIDSYKRLEQLEISGAIDFIEEKEYLEVQQQLAELFPSLIDYIDEKGEAHLKTAAEIDKEIAAMEELNELRKDEVINEAEDVYAKRVKSAQKYAKQVEEIENEIATKRKLLSDWEKNHASNFGEAEADSIRKKSAKMTRELEVELRIAQSMLRNNGQVLSNEVEKVFTAVLSRLTNNITPAIGEEMRKLISAMNFSELSAEEILEVQNVLAVFTSELDAAFKAGDQLEYNRIRSELSDYLDTMQDGVAIGETSVKTYTELAKAIANKEKNQKLANETDEEGIGTGEQLNETLQEQINKLSALSTASEIATGVSSKLVQETEDLVFIYDQLSGRKDLTREQTEKLSEAIQKLTLMYPTLTHNGEINTGMILQQAKANGVLLKATDELQKGKLTAEQTMTYNSAMGTKARLNNAIKEANTLLKLMEVYKDMAAEASKTQWDSMESLEAHRMYRETAARYDQVSISISDLTSEISGHTTNLSASMDATKDATKAQKDSSKAMEQSTYIADKYKRSLEELNLEIKKQQDIQSQSTEYSAQHQKAIEAEIKLQQDKMKLLQGQEKALQAQIKAGNILKTGVVTTKTGGDIVTPSGFGGRITSQFGMRGGRMHEGIDIASPTGTRQESNVSGTVIRAENHKTYGNMVRIEDASGNTHTYAHLDKIAVRVGEKVAEGMQIGTVGNTGRSKGSHLHYEVRDSSGKAINPANYVNEARKGISTASKEAAQVLSDIDKAQSELIDIQGQMIDQEALIAQLEIKSINASMAGFTHRKATNDKQLENSENRLKKMTSTSEEYRKELDYQREVLARKQKYNQEEVKFINELIAQGGLSAITVAELTDRLHQLGLENNNLKFEDDNTIQRQLDSYTRSFENRRGRLSRELEYEEAKLEGLEEGSERFFKTLEKINSLTERNISVDEEELAVWEDAIKSGKLYGDALAEAKTRAEELRNSLAGLSNGLRVNQERFAQAKFDINDKKIDETQDKIDFLSYKLSLLGEDDTELKIKVMLEMQTGIDEAIGNIDSAISEAVALRSKAIQSGNSTAMYDDRIKGYVASRRSQLSEMNTIYRNMQTMVTNAHSKIADAETKAYTDASKAIDLSIKASENRISVFSDHIDKLNHKMNTLQESDYDEKIGFTSNQLSSAKKIAQQIINEYDRVASIPVYNEEQQQQVEDKLRSLKAELHAANSQIIDYVKNLERTHFDRLISGANKAAKEIDRLTNKLNKNLELLDGGLLSGTSINLSPDSLVGNTLDLNQFINDPLSEKSIQTQIQDIRSSSYGQQLRDAEAYHAQMQAELARFQKAMVEEQEKYEKNLKLLMEIAKKEKEDVKKGEHQAIVDSTKALTKEEQVMLKDHYANLQSAMSFAMKSYRQEYSNIWNGIISDLNAKLKAIENMSLAASTAASNVKVPSPAPATKATPKTPPKYAKGTSGHPGGAAIIGEKGKELVILPDGSIGLSGSTSELVDLPKGTHVIPNKQTEDILKKKGIPAYASGTFNYAGRVFDSSIYYIDGNGDVINKLTGALVVSGGSAHSNAILEQNIADQAAGRPAYNGQSSYYSNGNQPVHDNYSYYFPEQNYSQPQPSYNQPQQSYYPQPDFNSYPIFDQIVEEIDEGLFMPVKKALVHSDSFVAKYDPYNRNGSNYERERQRELASISGYQKQLNSAKASGDTETVNKLTKEMLEKQDAQNLKDQQFVVESLTDLSQQRAKNSKELRDQLYDILTTEDLTEEAQNFYREEIIKLDNIIADSLLEQKKLVKQKFDYEQALRNKALDSINKEAEAVKDQMTLSELKDPNDYAAQGKQISKLIAIQKSYTKELSKQQTELEKQMSLFDVGSYQWNLIKAQLDGVTDAIVKAEIESANLNKQLQGNADKILDIIKKGYEKQRDLALNSLDKLMSELDKRYNDQIKKIDSAENERDFTKELEKEQKKQADLRRKINLLMLDDSQEAQAKRLALETELTNLTDSINEMQRKKSIEERKEALAKEYEEKKESLQKEKDETQYYYDELLSNEQHFADMRDEIVNNGTDNTKAKLGEFLGEFKDVNEAILKDLGMSFQSMVSMIKELEDAYKGLNAGVAFTSDNLASVGTNLSLNNNRSDTSPILDMLSDKLSFDKLEMSPLIRSGIFPELISPVSNASVGGETNYNLDLRIDNLNGTKRDVENFATTVLNTWKKQGK